MLGDDLSRGSLTHGSCLLLLETDQSVVRLRPCGSWAFPLETCQPDTRSRPSSFWTGGQSDPRVFLPLACRDGQPAAWAGHRACRRLLALVRRPPGGHVSWFLAVRVVTGKPAQVLILLKNVRAACLNDTGLPRIGMRAYILREPAGLADCDRDCSRGNSCRGGPIKLVITFGKMEEASEDVQGGRHPIMASCPVVSGRRSCVRPQPRPRPRPWRATVWAWAWAWAWEAPPPRYRGKGEARPVHLGLGLRSTSYRLLFDWL